MGAPSSVAFDAKGRLWVTSTFGLLVGLVSILLSPSLNTLPAQSGPVCGVWDRKIPRPTVSTRDSSVWPTINGQK